MPKTLPGDTQKKTPPPFEAPVAAGAPAAAAQYDANATDAPAAVLAPVAAAQYDKPLPSQPAATLEPRAVAKYDYATTHLRAQWMEVSSGRTNEMFYFVDPAATKQIPFTLAHTTVANQDEGLTYAVNDATVWMSTVYGNEALGALVLSNMITDPTSRARTQATVLDIANSSGVLPNWMAGGGFISPESEAAQNAFHDVMNSGDPLTAIQSLDPSLRLGVQTLAKQFYDSIQTAAARGDPLADQFGRVVAVARDGYQAALDSNQIGLLRYFVEKAQTGVGGTTSGNFGAAAEAAIGITQIRRLGGGQIVLDEQWARDNPDKALAEKEFLQAQYPDAQIVLGKQGIIGDVLDKFGMAIDYTLAVPGAFFNQAGELYQQAISGGQGNADLELRAAREASQAYNADGTLTPWLRQLLSRTGTDPADAQAVSLAIEHVRDNNTFDVGPGAFWQDLKDNTRPQMLGFGYADNVTKGLGILPGDPEYDIAHTAIGIVSQFAFDPAMWGPAVLGGLRDAGVLSRLIGEVGGVPKIVDEAGIVRELTVSRSMIHQFVYSALAPTADQAVQTKAFLNAASHLGDVARQADSVGQLATWLQTAGGLSLDSSRRMASILFPRAGATAEAVQSSAGIALLDDAMGNAAVPTLERQYAITSKLDEVNAALVAAPENVDLLAQRNVYEDILAGHETIRPADAGFMGGRQIRRVRSAAGLSNSAFDEAVDAVGRSIANFPANLIVRNSDDLARVTEAHPGAAPSIDAMFAKLGHLWRKPGFSTKFVFEDTTEFSRVSGVEAARQALKRAQDIGDTGRVATAQAQLDSALAELVNTPNTSLDALHSMARELGVNDQRYMQLVEPYVSGVLKGDRTAQYQWFKDTYSSLIKESTVLDGLGKKGLENLYQTWAEDRNAAHITVEGYRGVAHSEPVLVRQIPGVKPYGIPTIDADLIRSVDLPSLNDFRSYATATGRTMKQWEAAGDVRKAISSLHGSIANSWRTVTSWWRSWILGSRIFGALPLRIIGEQQLRMAAFDYSSMMWHPSEWFASTNWGARFFKDDAALWEAAGSPTHALGAMVDDMRTRVSVLGKSVAKLDSGVAAEQEAFFRSYSQMLTKYNASPSVTRWRLAGGVGDEIASPEEVLAAINQEVHAPLRDTWLRQFEMTRPLNDTRPASEIVNEALGRWDQEIRQVIGRDPEDIVKNAILNRKLVIDGADYEIGTPQFAKKLRELYDEGRWRPGMQELPTKFGEYLPGDKTLLMKDTTNKLFRMFYSRPDLATSRVPLYRQIFKRNYENFLKLGYSEDRAIEVARSVAAESTADILFQLGAHTNGEYLLREIMPFFPAYRELATTWIGRIPARLGALSESHAASVGWVLGATALAGRADLVLKTAQELGFVHQDTAGNYYLNVPWLGSALNWMTFGKFNDVLGGGEQMHVPLESMAGILPVPFGLANTNDQGQPLPLQERLRGVLPTIGGPSVAALALLKGAAPAFFGPVEDWVTMFGSDQSLGIPLIDQIIEGVSHEASPFALGRAGVLREAQVNFALVDGMRLAIHENPMPVWPGPNLTNAQSAQYEKDWLAWRQTVLKAGQDYQQHLYLLKGVVGAVLPFSIQYTDKYKAEIAGMWQMLNHLPGGSTSATGKAEMQLFLGRNPGLEPFLVSKTLDTRLYDNPNESLQDFFKAIGDGKVKVRNSNDWLTYAVATTSFSEHMARVAAIRAGAGDTWQEQLMNMDAKQELSREQDAWNAYLDWNHNNMAALGIPDVRSMLDQVSQYKAIRAGKVPQLTLDQTRLIAFDQTMRHYAQYFDYNPEHAGAYAKLRSQAYDALFKSLGQPSEISQGISDWFKNTADPYYQKLDKLYSSLETAKPNDIEQVYSDIRKLSDRYDANSHGDPTPEAYVFAKKNPAEQRQAVAKWAALPATYLTAFQRRQVGYEGNDTNLTKYSNYAAFTTRQLYIAAQKYGVGQGTIAWDNLKAQQVTLLANKAKELNVADTVKEYNKPTYQRVGRALDLTGTPSWNKISTWRQGADTYLAAARGGDGLSAAGNTPEAQRVRRIFYQHVEQLRADDPQLDAALNDAETALQETNHDQFYAKFFFDMLFGT